MDAQELLDITHHNYPDTIRITYSDELEKASILECSQVNNRFIRKSKSPVPLISSVESSLRLRSILSDQALRKQMESIHSLPALPAIYHSMTNELSSPHCSLLVVGQIIEQDVGLTSTVLRIVNSAFYGMNQRVESVAQGVALLGVHLIKNITLTAKVFSQFKGNNTNLQRLNQLNIDSCKVGVMANQFARYAKLNRSDVDHSQIAGMLCNVGEMIETLPGNNTTDNSEIANELLGAHLLRAWMMPDAVTEAVAMQYESLPVVDDSAITPLTILHSVRYLQQHFTDVNCQSQQEENLAYLSQWLPESTASCWLATFKDVVLLSDEAQASQAQASQARVA